MALFGATRRYPQTQNIKETKDIKFRNLDVALCGASRRYPQTQNIVKNKFSNFRIWMWRYVALCGAILRYQAQNASKNTLVSNF